MPGLHTSAPKFALVLFGLGVNHAISFGALTSATDFADLHPQYIAQLWTKDRGLPDNTIKAITQTADGYLWIATRAGLARFDGARFVVFNRANSPQLPSDEFLCLAPGENADLWIGTTDGLSRRSADLRVVVGQPASQVEMPAARRATKPHFGPPNT